LEDRGGRRERRGARFVAPKTFINSTSRVT
jgi:hypothetical protein